MSRAPQRTFFQDTPTARHVASTTHEDGVNERILADGALQGLVRGGGVVVREALLPRDGVEFATLAEDGLAGRAIPLRDREGVYHGDAVGGAVGIDWFSKVAVLNGFPCHQVST